MRVLFISANREDINMVTLPLGAALVAANVSRRGHEVRLLDLMESDDPLGEVKESVREFLPEAIGVSVRNIDDQSMLKPRFLLEQVREVVDAVRAHSNVPVILGGAGYSIFPQAALDYLDADLGVRGEGEWAMAELLDLISEGKDPRVLPGVYAKGGAKPAKRDFCGSLGELPWEDTTGWLKPVRNKPDFMLPVQTRRGCPMNCSYCSTPVIEGRRIRRCDPEIAAGAVQAHMRAGFERLFLTDNTFNLPPSHAKAFCRALIDRRVKPDWTCIIYPGRLDAELVRLMAEAGCTQVSLGFESGSDDILHRMNKRFTAMDIMRDKRLLTEAGIKVMGFLLLGLPGETIKTAEQSLAFVENLAPDLLRLTVGARIYPGTPLAEYAVSQGIIDPSDDLLRPRFYVEPGLEDDLLETASKWGAGRPRCLTDLFR